LSIVKLCLFFQGMHIQNRGLNGHAKENHAQGSQKLLIHHWKWADRFGYSYINLNHLNHWSMWTYRWAYQVNMAKQRETIWIQVNWRNWRNTTSVTLTQSIYKSHGSRWLVHQLDELVQYYTSINLRKSQRNEYEQHKHMNNVVHGSTGHHSCWSTWSRVS
jgi:hypothetical protein